MHICNMTPAGQAFSCMIISKETPETRLHIGQVLIKVQHCVKYMFVQRCISHYSIFFFHGGNMREKRP